MPVNLGYCCINTELSKQGITTGRSMIKKTFDERGLEYASELAVKNARDLYQIIKWNQKNNIRVFRMGSGIFPWASEYKLEDLPNFDNIVAELRYAGEYAASHDVRITAHPDHFVKLASTKSHVVDNSIAELELHSRIFDMMNLSYSAYNAINIHVGMNFSEDVAKRWIDGFNRLSLNCQRRIVVENDDKLNGFSVLQLFTYIFSKEAIPITLDYFHHKFHPNKLSLQDAAHLAAGTWPSGITPLFHYSESKALNESVTCNPRAHSDYIFRTIDDFGLTLDIDIEAKAKEQALLHYRRNRKC